MIKKLLSLAKKNIIILNILLILIFSIFFSVNKEKFNSYRSYIDYEFEERRLLQENNTYEFVNHYLSDIEFVTENYDFSILNKDISLNTDLENQKLRFIFNSKRNTFNFGSNYSQNFYTNSINDFVKDSLKKYHISLEILLLKRLELINKTKSQLNTKFFKSDLQEIKINEDNIQIYLSLLSDGKKIIKSKGYNVKYRRIFLNTDEYLISCLILLILFNFIIKNYKSIIN